MNVGPRNLHPILTLDTVNKINKAATAGENRGNEHGRRRDCYLCRGFEREPRLRLGLRKKSISLLSLSLSLEAFSPPFQRFRRARRRIIALDSFHP